MVSGFLPTYQEKQRHLQSTAWELWDVLHQLLVTAQVAEILDAAIAMTA